MNIILRKLIQYSLRNFAELSKLDNPRFGEGLAELKKKLPQDSAPSKRIKSKMDIKKCRVKDGIYYVARDKKNRSNKKVLFIHGGGFILEAMPLHWRLCQRLARDTGCEIIFPQYPMVPESNAKECHIMLMEVYRELMKNSRPEDVTIIGDSAGGTLSLSLSMLAIEKGLPVANEIILISPGFIIGKMSEKERRRADYIQEQDCIIGHFPVDKVSELWLGDLDVNNYRADATKGSISGLPHITMFSGTHDIMNIPARRFAAKMKREGHPYSYYEKKQGAHDYALLKKSRKEYEIILSRII